MILYKKRWFDGTAAALFLCMSAWSIQWEPLDVVWANKPEVISFDFSNMFRSELSKPFLMYLIDPVAESNQTIQSLDLPKIQQSVIENERLQGNAVLEMASGFFKLHEKALLFEWAQNTVSEQVKKILAEPALPNDTASYQAESPSYMFSQTTSRKTSLVKEPDLNVARNQDVLQRHEFFSQKNKNQTDIFSKEVINLLKQVKLEENQKQVELSEEKAVEQPIEQKVSVVENKPEKKRILHDDNLEKVKALINDGQSALATTQLQMYANQYPSIAAYRILLAELYLKNKQYAALKNLILNDFPDQEKPRELMELLARAYIEQTNYDEALALLNQYADNIERSPTTHGLIANVYQRMQVYDKSATIYRQLIEHFPQAGKWWLGFAISLEGQRRSSEALSAYHRALTDDRLPLGLKTYAKERVDYLTQKVKQDS